MVSKQPSPSTTRGEETLTSDNAEKLLDSSASSLSGEVEDSIDQPVLPSSHSLFDDMMNNEQLNSTTTSKNIKKLTRIRAERRHAAHTDQLIEIGMSKLLIFGLSV